MYFQLPCEESITSSLEDWGATEDISRTDWRLFLLHLMGAL